MGHQHAPTPGVHNSGWVQAPGADRIDDKNGTRTLQDDVTGVMTEFRNDDRVLGWDVWNEPDNPRRSTPVSSAATSWTGWQICSLKPSPGRAPSTLGSR